MASVFYVCEGPHCTNKKKEQCSIQGDNSWKYSFFPFLFQLILFIRQRKLCLYEHLCPCLQCQPLCYSVALSSLVFSVFYLCGCALFALSLWMWFSTVPAASWPELSVWNLFCWLKSYSSSMWYKVWLFGLSLALCGIVVFFTVSFMSHMPVNSVTLNYPFCCKCTGSSSSSFYCSS